VGPRADLYAQFLLVQVSFPFNLSVIISKSHTLHYLTIIVLYIIHLNVHDIHHTKLHTSR